MSDAECPYKLEPKLCKYKTGTVCIVAEDRCPYCQIYHEWINKFGWEAR